MDNLTAKVSCFARAYHHRNNEVRIFDDYMAGEILGDDYTQVKTSMMNGIDFFLPGFKGTKEEGLRVIVDTKLSPSVLIRSTYCETKLSQELAKGCKQYLMFASGYDTYGLRNNIDNLSVFELDMIAMIDDKIERIKKANLNSSSIYVPSDLTNNSFVYDLIRKGYQVNECSFSSLLGISYYLTKKEFKELLKTLNDNSALGSSICFDYPLDVEEKQAKTIRNLASGAKENMKAQYSYLEIESILKECGYMIVDYLSSKLADETILYEYNKLNAYHKISAPKAVEYIIARKII